MLTHVIIVFLSCVARHVTSHFQCQGTCYSGSFPKGSDAIEGQHLRGHSYKNITTDVPHTCFSSCINDCRCKAFQMKDVRCELLDEDKTSKSEDFVAKTGYVYYNLQQKLYQGKSHMVHSPGVCYNGCCRRQPCMNGGTCVEHCADLKVKFTCTCKSKYYGKLCQNRDIHSCIDVLKTSLDVDKVPKNGVYDINRDDTNTGQPFYCAFEGSYKAWTLIESFSFANKNLYATRSFADNFYRNIHSPNWSDYRLKSLTMNYLESKSTMFRATCDFPTRDSLTPDFLLGYLSDYKLISSASLSGGCIKFAHINIRGHDFYNTTAPVWQKQSYYHFAIDASWNRCSFNVPGTIKSEDNFGVYYAVNPLFTCTASQQSTTQWWLGEEEY